MNIIIRLKTIYILQTIINVMTQKKVIVISLGGSLIAPDKIDYKFLERFRKILRKNYKKYKFVVVCGGGKVARNYIEALKKEHKSEKEQSLAGIRITRENAQLMMQFFGKDANETLPLTIKQVESHLVRDN